MRCKQQIMIVSETVNVADYTSAERKCLLISDCEKLNDLIRKNDKTSHIFPDRG